LDDDILHLVSIKLISPWVDVSIFQNSLGLQGKKAIKSGDFLGTAQTLLGSLGGNLSNPKCGSSKLDNNSAQLGDEILNYVYYI
jgi:hypothetical protein